MSLIKKLASENISENIVKAFGEYIEISDSYDFSIQLLFFIYYAIYESYISVYELKKIKGFCDKRKQKPSDLYFDSEP